MLNKLVCYLLLLLFGVSTSVSAQTYNVALIATEAEQKILDKLAFEKTLSDTSTINNLLSSILLQLHGQSYLEASVDKIERKDSTIYARMHIGNPYQWAHLKNGNVEDVFLDAIGFREKLYSKKDFRYNEVQILQEELLTYAENHGYPFAAVYLDSIQIRDNKVNAQLKMNKSKLITISKINIEGDLKISEAYLLNYLGLEKGAAYDNSKIKRIRQRLQELPFLKEAKGSTVSFKGDKAEINLFLKKRKASRFDFLVGVLPNSTSQQNPQTRQFLITGTFNADMWNQFGKGEQLYAEFQQLRPQTQELDLRFNYPFVLNLPFGVGFEFELYKRDTTYLDVKNDASIQYLYEGGNYLKAFWNNHNTTLLSVDANRVRNTKQLPSNLDVGLSTFGLEYNLQKLDYRFNPRKGWGVLVRGGAGFKKIKPNNTILNIEQADGENFNYQSLYDSLNLNTFQYRLEANVAKYFPIFKRSTIKVGARSSWIISESDIYQNEQYRIGGNKVLRGFDEESIFSTLYVVGTLEYRLLLGRNSYTYLFTDYAYVEDVTNERAVYDTPLGFGAGLTFDTKVGVFGISYALGKQLGNPVDFRAAKIHFGYVSFF